MVVLAEHEGGVVAERQQIGTRIRLSTRPRGFAQPPGLEIRRSAERALVARGVVGERAGRDLAEDLAAGAGAHAESPGPPSGGAATTWPTTLARISNFSQMAVTAASLPGSTMASMRSWLSLVMISTGLIPSSGKGRPRCRRPSRARLSKRSRMSHT